jgi:hypothetical protein
MNLLSPLSPPELIPFLLTHYMASYSPMKSALNTSILLLISPFPLSMLPSATLPLSNVSSVLSLPILLVVEVRDVVEPHILPSSTHPAPIVPFVKSATELVILHPNASISLITPITLTLSLQHPSSQFNPLHLILIGILTRVPPTISPMTSPISTSRLMNIMAPIKFELEMDKVCKSYMLVLLTFPHLTKIFLFLISCMFLTLKKT